MAAVTTSVLARQVLLTLSYSDQFEFPLTAEEIWQRLIATPGLYFTRRLVDQSLVSLRGRGVIENRDGFYTMAGRGTLVDTRRQRKVASQEKVAVVEHFLHFARVIPWIQAVAITGSLAVDNAQAQSDIDFMVVTQANRLWLTRLIVLFLTRLVGKQRTDIDERPNSWCFNIWVDEHHLALPMSKRSVYTAYEVCQAKWVYDKNKITQQFYQANNWVVRYLPNAFSVSGLLRKKTDGSNPFLSLLDRVCFMAQKFYMYPHLTRELVGYGLAYFHPRDTRRLVYTRWQHVLRQSQ